MISPRHNNRTLICANFLHSFKGAPCTPRLAARDRARDPAGRVAVQQEAGATRPRRTTAPSGGRSPYRGSARRRPPRHRPRQLAAPMSAATPPRVREQGHPPGAVIAEPSKITVKAVCARRPTATGQDDQAHIYAKPALMVIPIGSIRRQSEGWPGPDSPSCRQETANKQRSPGMAATEPHRPDGRRQPSDSIIP